MGRPSIGADGKAKVAAIPSHTARIFEAEVANNADRKRPTRRRRALNEARP